VCKRQTTQEYLQDQGAQNKEAPPKQNELQVDTHTKKRVSPPILKAYVPLPTPPPK